MIDLHAVAEEKKIIRHFIDSRIQAHFDKDFVDFSKRCRIESDVEKWRDDIKEIWDQNKGNRARWYSLYFDNEFLLSFPMDQKPGQVELLILKNLTRMIEDEDIFLDLNEYKIREEIKKIEQENKDAKYNKMLESERPEVKQIIKELNANKTA